MCCMTHKDTLHATFEFIVILLAFKHIDHSLMTYVKGPNKYEKLK